MSIILQMLIYGIYHPFFHDTPRMWFVYIYVDSFFVIHKTDT